jgi:plasmid stabilization system protein ParE
MACYCLTPTANDHYWKVVSDTRQKWGSTQAVKYRAALRTGFQKIADDHKSFHSPHREGLARGTDFDLHLIEHHYVAFQVRNDQLVIIAGIFHKYLNPLEGAEKLKRARNRCSNQEKSALASCYLPLFCYKASLFDNRLQMKGRALWHNV